MLKEQCGAVHNPTSTVLVVTVVHICADRRAWDKLFIGTTPSPVAKRQHLVSVDVKPQQSVTGPRSADLTAVYTLSDLRHPTSASRAHTHTHTLNNVPLTYAPEMNCSYAAAKILLAWVWRVAALTIMKLTRGMTAVRKSSMMSSVNLWLLYVGLDTGLISYCRVSGVDRQAQWQGVKRSMLPVTKVSRFYWAFWPWGLESKVTFAQDIPYKQVHEHQ